MTHNKIEFDLLGDSDKENLFTYFVYTLTEVVSVNARKFKNSSLYKTLNGQ